MSTDLTQRFAALWASLTPIGRAPSGDGYLRYSWTPVASDLTEWFIEEALDRDLDLNIDGNDNLWATWVPDGVDQFAPGIATGSHLDSVPHGGAYDGPLGVVSALLAIDEMRARGVTPRKPIRVAVFIEEEGARFGVACLGSRLLTGAITPEEAAALRDKDGISLGEARGRLGHESNQFGADPARMAGIEAFVELHIEQGRAMTVPVGIGDAIWPHGRWRLDIAGVGNHAGTTRMDDRSDPMLTFAYAVLAANKEARLHGAHATVGRVHVEPNATNAIPSSVTGWLDARAADESTLAKLVDAIGVRVGDRAERDGTTITLTAESSSPETVFSETLIDRIRAVLPDAPVLPTGAGHDAGVLAGHVPTAMLFVRNPTGVSHAPAEAATDHDCAAGITALADVLTALAG